MHIFSDIVTCVELIFNTLFYAQTIVACELQSLLWRDFSFPMASLLLNCFVTTTFALFEAYFVSFSLYILSPYTEMDCFHSAQCNQYSSQLFSLLEQGC